jgi:ATPase subunit of ABC transporter with duplicated ATPase domains
MGGHSHKRSKSREEKHHHKSKKHGKREKRVSSSSNSSDDSPAPKSFDKRLEKIRLEKLRQKEAEKRSRKERETPEEKRARRIAKKLQKVCHIYPNFTLFLKYIYIPISGGEEKSCCPKCAAGDDSLYGHKQPFQ